MRGEMVAGRAHALAWASGVDVPYARHLMCMAAMLALFVLVRVLFVSIYKVPSGSMLETIQLGDLVFSERLSYCFRRPAVGEVVAFEDPENRGTTLIKRVVAEAGDVVDLRGGRVYVNGVALDEPYTRATITEPITRHSAALGENVAYPHTVAKGCVWLMGDNRENSLDSRYFGDVEVGCVLSRVLMVYWPVEHVCSLGPQVE